MAAAAARGRGPRGARRWSASTTGGCRRSPSPGSWSRTGRLGTVRHVRAQYLQDWIVDPDFPLVWRLRADKAGSGALGDIGAHIVDVTQFVTGELLTGVSALPETFVKQRPLPSASAGLSATGGAGVGDVTVDDAALFLGRLDGGAIASYEATRFAHRPQERHAGRDQRLGWAASPSTSSGSTSWSSTTAPRTPPTPGFRRILVTEPTHPYVGAWWPPGHTLGYEHTFTHEVKDLVRAIGGRRPTRYRRSRTDCRCSGCSTRCSAPPPTAAAGPTIRRRV